jgi:hypothetical protein
VRVRYDEGVATRIGPEPCVGGREVDGEASAGEVKGFGRRPLSGRSSALGAGVRKPPKQETAGRKGAGWSGASYGDLRIAGGSRVWRGRAAERSLAVGTDDGERVGSGKCAGLAQAWRSDEDWRPRENIGFLLRLAGGGEGKRGCAAGGVATVMRCRS